MWIFIICYALLVIVVVGFIIAHELDKDPPKKKDRVYNYLKDRFHIKKSEIKEMGINPNKQWYDLTELELRMLANHLKTTIHHILDCVKVK